MYQKYLNKLEFDKIKKILETYAITYIGKSFVSTLTPYTNIEEAKQALAETTESYILLYRKGAPPLFDIQNIHIYLKTLETQGSLSAKALLELGHILKLSRELKEYFNKDIDTSFCVNLVKYFSRLYSNPNIERSILTSIIDEQTIDDHASTNLWHIRKDIKKAESDIRQKLNSYLHASYIQEPVVTIRAGRFVIPVKQEMRNEITGFIHDISSSGSTVFIEPTTVFELNNKITSLKLEEKNEIEKILHDLTTLLYPYVEELNEDIQLIGKIDFSFAKAKYGRAINATEPVLITEKKINFMNARHPLINSENVVPISIPIGDKFSCLVVTGPNTGGKTVTLKTVGLLCIMASSGLYIPADEKSSCFVFDNIFADIGDEQSIQESLSTFSSHITNIIEILKNATNNSLVLLDELGSGTDPVEGSSLAISILDAFKKKGCIIFSTTHYPEVKNFALVTDGFENASSEFDVETLKPTYKLLIGVPGQSNAFAISKRLGLDQKILDEATSLISSNRISTEDLLKSIYSDKKLIEKEKEEILKNSKDIENLKVSLEQQKKALSKQENNSIKEAKEQAKHILIEAKEEADEIIRKLEKTTSKSEANKLRKKLKDQILKTSANNETIITQSLSKDDINPGDFVKVKSLNLVGTILNVPNKSRKSTNTSWKF